MGMYALVKYILLNLSNSSIFKYFLKIFLFFFKNLCTDCSLKKKFLDNCPSENLFTITFRSAVDKILYFDDKTFIQISLSSQVLSFSSNPPSLRKAFLLKIVDDGFGKEFNDKNPLNKLLLLFSIFFLKKLSQLI